MTLRSRTSRQHWSGALRRTLRSSRHYRRCRGSCACCCHRPLLESSGETGASESRAPGRRRTRLEPGSGVWARLVLALTHVHQVGAARVVWALVHRCDQDRKQAVGRLLPALSTAGRSSPRSCRLARTLSAIRKGSRSRVKAYRHLTPLERKRGAGAPPGAPAR